jgi:hypothetical protein
MIILWPRTLKFDDQSGQCCASFGQSWHTRRRELEDVPPANHAIDNGLRELLWTGCRPVHLDPELRRRFFCCLTDSSRGLFSMSAAECRKGVLQSVYSARTRLGTPGITAPVFGYPNRTAN